MLSRDDDKHEYDWLSKLVGRHTVEDIEMR